MCEQFTASVSLDWWRYKRVHLTWPTLGIAIGNLHVLHISASYAWYRGNVFTTVLH